MTSSTTNMAFMTNSLFSLLGQVLFRLVLMAAWLAFAYFVWKAAGLFYLIHLPVGALFFGGLADMTAVRLFGLISRVFFYPHYFLRWILCTLSDLFQKKDVADQGVPGTATR